MNAQFLIVHLLACIRIEVQYILGKLSWSKGLFILGTLGFASIAFRELTALLVALDELTINVSDDGLS